MTFYVGQKVVCIKRMPLRNGTPDIPNVKVGAVYTVRSVVHFEGYGEGLRLVEIINPVRDTAAGRIEQAYASYRFRPVVERKTDTGFAILEEIRNRETIPVREQKSTRRRVHASHE